MGTFCHRVISGPVWHDISPLAQVAVVVVVVVGLALGGSAVQCGAVVSALGNEAVSSLIADSNSGRASWDERRCGHVGQL